MRLLGLSGVQGESAIATLNKNSSLLNEGRKIEGAGNTRKENIE